LSHPTAIEIPTAELESVAARALDAARRAGATHADTVVERSRSFSVQVNDGVIDTLKQSATHGLGLRVIVDDAVGFVSTNDLRPEVLDDLARRAVALARLSTPDPANAVPTLAEADATSTDDGAGLDLYDPAVLELPAQRKIDLAFELERVARAHDPRVTRCDHVGFGSHDGVSVLANSAGIMRAERGTSVSMAVVALADDGGGKQQSGGYGLARRRIVDLPSAESVAEEAARRAVARIGARSVPAARVPVVMHPDIAASWISEMAGAFSGEEVMKKSSWLADHLGERVASPLVTLVDDARMPWGLGSCRWDGEGMRTRRNVLIDRGACAMFVYDLYHARRTGNRSTGNASRSYGSVPHIGYHNLHIVAGDESPESILKRVDRGFYMDDQGSFGYNDVTGDYSFQAQGFWIENGEKAFPVEGVTVASTSLEMLKNVVAVGNDLRFDGSIAAPTLLIAEMTVSGKG
jgi:PmbA protein